MSRIRTYVVGRDRTCDVRLDDESVSRRHAEVVRVEKGRLYVTDRATTNGTFVLDGRRWQAIRQSFVEPADSLRFGDCEMTAERLDGLCLRDGAGSPGGHDAVDGTGAPAVAGDALDPTHGVERVPETGELVEKEPPRRRR